MKAKKTKEKKKVGRPPNPPKPEKKPYERFVFPQGNNFWTRRSKHGRDRLFETPKELWEACCEYFRHCDENPFLEAVQGKSCKPIQVEEGKFILAPEIIELPKMKPYTLHGLVGYLNASINFFNMFEESLKSKVEKDKTDIISSDFLLVITRAREIIYNQKFTGAASGFFNSNIIARDLGLADKNETAINAVEFKKTVSDLFPPDIIESIKDEPKKS